MDSSVFVIIINIEHNLLSIVRELNIIQNILIIFLAFSQMGFFLLQKNKIIIVFEEMLIGQGFLHSCRSSFKFLFSGTIRLLHILHQTAG